MKSKKVIFKAINTTFFTYYLVITLAMAGGVSEKLRDGNGNLNQVPNQDSQFSDFYDFGWELAELIYLPLLLIICLLNLLLRRKFKQSKVTLIYSIYCIILPGILFILKILFLSVRDIYLGSSFKNAIGFLRMFVVYNNLIFLLIEKKDMTGFISSPSEEDAPSEIEIYRQITENAQNSKEKDRENILYNSEKNMAKKEELELVLVNNKNPLKSSQIKSPKIISIISEVPNRIPLLLVEKVKIPKFINTDANTDDEMEPNNSADYSINHPHPQIVEDLSIIYQNDNPNVNEKYSKIISELNRIPDLTFNVFNLSTFSDGNELLVVMSHLMHMYNFSETLQINRKKFKNYFYLVNKKYRKNPYHNSIHGCDVTQTVYFILKTCNVETICNLNELELFSCFFASAIHDLDHPGNNNNYEIAVGSTLAISYNDKAVLENYHLAKAFSLMRKDSCDVFENFSRTNYNLARALIINMVLSTDMANHFPDLNFTNNRLKSEDFNPSGTDKQILLNEVIHASDISNPIKPFDIYMEWIKRVFCEFYNQGDKERELGFKLSYLCDRYTVNILDAQLGFIDGIVLPLFTTLSIAFPNMKMIVNLINNNKEEFKKKKENGEKITI